MKAIYALVFVCMTVPALALDLDAPATETPVIEFDYAAPIAPYGVYASEDESIDPTVDFTRLDVVANGGHELDDAYDYGFDLDLTASIPATDDYLRNYFPPEAWIDGAYPY
ncbi:MAG: hypothetical protein IT539_04340 [Bradyrhizobiaceae bacterium]|nr:hypothetical protein [Bradyrhizobiaceae bacterium]